MVVRKVAQSVALGAMVAASTLPALAQSKSNPDRCNAQFEAAIDKLGFDRSKITKQRNEVALAGRSGSTVVGYRAWLSSNACEGSVVVSLHSDCGFDTTFTRGGCKEAMLK